MISREDVDNVANLARLELDEAQKESLVKDLGNILGYIEQLKEVHPDAVKTADAAEGHMAPNIMRADKVTNNLEVEPPSGSSAYKLVEAAPKHDEKCSYVRVKKIL